LFWKLTGQRMGNENRQNLDLNYDDDDDDDNNNNNNKTTL